MVHSIQSKRRVISSRSQSLSAGRREYDMNKDAGAAKPLFFAGLFLICMCGLMLQIIETRILSVITWYYLAFLAISMAMFGMTAGSLYVYFRPSQFTSERLLENLTWACSAFAVTWPSTDPLWDARTALCCRAASRLLCASGASHGMRTSPLV